MKQQEVGTIVGSSVHLTGSIKDSSDITIFGSVNGEVNSEQRIIIEETARVKGPVNAREVLISGVVAGTITAKEKIELTPSGVIKGNIDTKELLIHSGAILIGKCTMPDKKGETDKMETEEPLETEAEIDVEQEDKKE